MPLSSEQTDIRKKIIRILQYFLLLGTGISLSYYFFKDYNFEELLFILKTGNTKWIFAVMAVSLTVYIIRVLRWQLLIGAMGHSATFSSGLSSLSIGYFVSLFIPRFGELTRCLLIKKQHKISLSGLIGTVIVERAVDIICLFLLLLLTFAVQFKYVSDFILRFIFTPLHELISNNFSGARITVIALIFGLTGILLFIFIRKKIKLSGKFSEVISNLKNGLLSIVKMKEKRLFWAYTGLIWLCYYLMTYFWFFVFDQKGILSAGACLSIITIGSVGRSVPIQGGGMGAYHFMVTGVVMAYGAEKSFGEHLAVLIHAGQLLFTVFMGLVGFVLLYPEIYKRKKAPVKTEALN
jgi:glycosyltransferase 2 family protein